MLICGKIFLIKQYFETKSVVELIGITILTAFCIIIIYFSVDFFKDITNVVNKNYIVATGTAEGWDTAGQDPETRGFAFKKDDGETIEISVIYTPVYQGNRFEVIYLPNTGYGAIVKKLESGELP